jgi:hypothetical protein
MEQLGSAYPQGSVNNDCEGDRTEQYSRRFVIAYDVETRQFVETIAPHPSNAPPRVQEGNRQARSNLKRRIDAVLTDRNEYEEESVKQARCVDVPGSGAKSPRSDDIPNAPVVSGAVISRDSEESLLFATLLLCNFGYEPAADSSLNGDDDSAVEQRDLELVPEEADALHVVANVVNLATASPIVGPCGSPEYSVCEDDVQQRDNAGVSRDGGNGDGAKPDVGTDSGAAVGADVGADADGNTSQARVTQSTVSSGVVMVSAVFDVMGASREVPEATEGAGDLYHDASTSFNELAPGPPYATSVAETAPTVHATFCTTNVAAAAVPMAPSEQPSDAPVAALTDASSPSGSGADLVPEHQLPVPHLNGTQQPPASHGKLYTEQEVARIRQAFRASGECSPPVPLHRLVTALAAELNRKSSAIESKLRDLGLMQPILLPSASMVEARQQAAVALQDTPAARYLLAHELCSTAPPWLHNFLVAANGAVRDGVITAEVTAQLISRRTRRSVEASMKLLQDLALQRERDSEWAPSTGDIYK